MKFKLKLKFKLLKLVSENIKEEEDKENEFKLRLNFGSDVCDERKDILIDLNEKIVCRDFRGELKFCVLLIFESFGKLLLKFFKFEYLLKLLENYDSNRIVMLLRRSILSRLENNSSFGKFWLCVYYFF